MATNQIQAQAAEEAALVEYTQEVRAAHPEYAPTFIIMHEEMGGGYTDLGSMPSIPGDDGETTVAVIRQVFAPRITNISAIDIYRRKRNTPPVLLLVETRYPNMKADCVGLNRVGDELLIFAGTHITDVPLGPNGERKIAIEKDEIAGYFTPVPTP